MNNKCNERPVERILLTAREVANLTGFSEGTIRHFCNQRRIPLIRISSRCVRFDRNAIENWIASLSVPTESIDPNRVCKQKSRGKKKENTHES